MKKRTSFGTYCLALFVTCLGVKAEHFHSLTPSAGFGPLTNGMILADGSVSFMTTDTAQRGMAFNPVTGNLIFVDRATSGQGSSFSGAIYVLDGTTGEVITTLTPDGIDGGSYATFAAGVADDGAIYVGNMITTSNAGPYKIYRWDSESSTNAPTVAYSGDPGDGLFPDLRWGDTMDVRGAGTNTQIIIGSRVTGSATKVTIFTTADGSNFTAHGLSSTVTASLFAGGVSFAEGNTFWAKRSTLNLGLYSFDLDLGTVTTLRNLGATDMPEIVSHDAVMVDAANDVMATLSFNGGGVPDQVFLYDIGNSNDLPQLLDVFTLPIDNPNGTGIAGYLNFGDGKLFVHSVNNGLFSFDLDAGPLPAPDIIAHPGDIQALAGSFAKFRVIAQRGFSFQWQKGGTPITDATNSVLTLTNLQDSDSANYSVVVSNSTSAITSSNALLTVLSLEDFYRLTPIWSTAPNAQPYFVITGGSQSTPNQRSLAYNSFSNHLYVASRQGSSSANFTVYVVDAETGDLLYTLNTNGVTFAGQIGLVSIEVAGDGAIYACNVDIATPNQWRLYRWADGNSNTLPQIVFEGDPLNSGSSFRWGDAMHVRGAGIDTQVIIDNRETANPFVAILKPADASLTDFDSQFFFLENTFGNNTFGRTIQFGSGDRFWQKRRTFPLVHSSFDLTDGSFIAPVVDVHTNFGNFVSHVAVDESRNLLGAINLDGVAGSVPDHVELYDITDPDSPVLLSQHGFPVPKAGNTGFAGKVLFGGDKMFALQAQNGLVAFRVDIGAPPPSLTISRSGSDVVLSWEGSDFVLEATTNIISPSWLSIPYQAGSPNTATEMISGSAKFYRLRK